jgi:hypothetical protein
VIHAFVSRRNDQLSLAVVVEVSSDKIARPLPRVDASASSERSGAEILKGVDNGDKGVSSDDVRTLVKGEIPRSDAS